LSCLHAVGDRETISARSFRIVATIEYACWAIIRLNRLRSSAARSPFLSCRSEFPRCSDPLDRPSHGGVCLRDWPAVHVL